MLITRSVLAFGVRYAFNESADHIMNAITKRLTDHSQALPRALSKANDRAWEAVGLALAGDGLFTWVKDLLRDADLKGVRDQIKKFLDQTPTGLEGTPAGLRAKAAEEWARLRKAGRLIAAIDPATDLASRAATMERHGDPARMTAAALQAVKETAEALRSVAPHLADLLTTAPSGGSPLLAAAFAFFFRREVETNPELAHGLTFDYLRVLSERQERGLDLLDMRTAGILDQIGVLFDYLDEINGKLDELISKRDVATRTTDPLKISVTNEKELTLLRKWLAELRALPPELIDAALWAKLGDALAAGRILAEARAAQEAAAATAKAAADRGAEAEAAYKMYRVACEQEEWADALIGLVRAATLDSARFAPFPFNRYEPIRILGAGGFGTVVLCRERLKKNREVAVKSLHPGDLGRSLEELFGEAHTVSELDNPAIIKVIHWDFADPAETRPFLVMEYFSGVSLAAHLKQHGTLSVSDFIVVARNIAEGMTAAHEAGVLHRDLKPGNILIRQDGAGRWNVRVIDFGLAVRFSAVQASVSTSLPHRTRRDQSFAGTLEYASPEQKGLNAAPIGPRSDIYSFGRTMLEALLETRVPITDDWDMLPPEYRDGLRRLLEKCVAEHPTRRHPGFDPIVQALAALDPAERSAPERVAAEQQKQADAAERARLAAGRARQEAAEKQRAEAERVTDQSDPRPTTQAEGRRATEDVAQRDAEVFDRAAPVRVPALPRRMQDEAEEQSQGPAAKQKASSAASGSDLFDPTRRRAAGDTVTITLPGDIHITFAWCPRGTFLMGSNHPEGGDNEKPAHRVKLTKGFYMGIYPVTQAQWKAITGLTPAHFKGDQQPVERVSWDDCQGFCEKVTGHLNGVVTVRLPSEAEWEYACRAGTTTEFHFGDVITPELVQYTWDRSWNGSPTRKSPNKTTDVGSFPPNPWGLFDVHGNVFEWCQDWYGPYEAKAQTDPHGVKNGKLRVLRGGCWGSVPSSCRSAFRFDRSPKRRGNYGGFRVCFHIGREETTKLRREKFGSPLHCRIYGPAKVNLDIGVDEKPKPPVPSTSNASRPPRIAALGDTHEAVRASEEEIHAAFADNYFAEDNPAKRAAKFSRESINGSVDADQLDPDLREVIASDMAEGFNPEQLLDHYKRTLDQYGPDSTEAKIAQTAAEAKVLQGGAPTPLKFDGKPGNWVAVNLQDVNGLPDGFRCLITQGAIYRSKDMMLVPAKDSAAAELLEQHRAKVRGLNDDEGLGILFDGLVSKSVVAEQDVPAGEKNTGTTSDNTGPEKNWDIHSVDTYKPLDSISGWHVVKFGVCNPQAKSIGKYSLVQHPICPITEVLPEIYLTNLLDN